MHRTLTIALIVLIAGLLAGLAYFIFQNKRLIKNLSSSPSPTTSTVAQTSPQTSPSPIITKQSVQKTIETNINTKNYTALKDYLAESIDFTLWASECCGMFTKDEAIEQMTYIDDGIPFDFNQNSPTVLNLKAKNPHLANSYIGISKNSEHSAAFTINNQNQISAIQLSVSWKLYEQ